MTDRKDDDRSRTVWRVRGRFEAAQETIVVAPDLPEHSAVRVDRRVWGATEA
jgi:hypothetical protein